MASSMIVVGRPGTVVSCGQQAGWPFKQDISPLVVTLGANSLTCAISRLGPTPTGFNEGVAFDPNDPASFTTTVFGSGITAFSPKQGEDRVSSLSIGRPAARLSPAA
jgi:hypothetical protein